MRIKGKNINLGNFLISFGYFLVELLSCTEIFLFRFYGAKAVQQD